MRTFLLILSFIALQAQGQVLFHAHNRNAAAPPFGPAAISGLRFWFKADTLVQTSGGRVSAWHDQSGNVGPFTPAAGALGPVPETCDGYPALRFSSADNTALQLPTVPNTSVHNTLIIVFKRASTAFQMLATSSSVPAQYLATYDPGLYQLTSPSGTSGPGLAAITIEFDGTDWRSYVNNVLTTSHSFQQGSWSDMLLGKWSGGTPYSWDGWVLDVIYIDRILTATERSELHNAYIKTSYPIIP